MTQDDLDRSRSPSCLSDEALLDEIGRGLREAYEAVLIEPLPKRLTGLIERIELAANSNAQGAELRAYVTRGRGG